jgi:hypothetical protein
MEAYATKYDTVNVLLDLGFIQTDKDYFDSPNSNDKGMPIVEIRVYQCHNNYFCVDANGDWGAPVTWNGPKAEWDKTNETELFVSWLNDNHPGWK